MTDPKDSESPAIANGEADTPQAKAGIVKDKQCQYCGQAFTSSSLGRHLDQFISKKKPDGVHDVEEIKKLRASITRRQPRGSNQKNHGDEADSEHSPAPADARSQSPVTIAFDDSVPKEGVHVFLNTFNWQATGVINGLNDSGSPASRPAPSALKRTPSTLEQGKPDTSDKDTIRALELALREVLDTVQAASARSPTLTSPFDFDFQGQTYPSLVLLLLPLPPSLHAAQPISTPNCVPLDYPGPKELQAVREQVQSLIDRWRVNNLSDKSQSGSYHSPTILDVAKQHTDMARQHIELAYQNWAPLPHERKQEVWRLELMRIFAREIERRKDKGEHLNRVEQEFRRLQKEVDMLSRCQWPREFALFPPERRTTSTTTSSELRQDFGPNSLRGIESYWDYDNLVQKWKKVVFEDAARRLMAQTPSSKLTPVTGNAYSPNTASRLAASELMRPGSHPSLAQVDLPPPSKKVRITNGGKEDRREGSSGTTSRSDGASPRQDLSRQLPLLKENVTRSPAVDGGSNRSSGVK